ncbi:DNA ligase 1-like [Mytilus edulis]|uniref:DNA ligase 1-like n=1 Tax=Mytilus edulis TaxID=6550 RepID=UPI0039EFCA7B
MSTGLILRLLIRQNIKMTEQDKREQHALYFYEAILSEAVFECILEEWENLETDKRTSLKKEMEDTDNLHSENEENKMMILQKWKNRENDMIAEEQQTTTGLVITKIYQQKIAENPFKHAEGYVYQNLEEKNAKDKPKKKREIRREEKRRLKRAREEEKMIKKQFEIIDTKMENYSREVKVQWKKELKREQMTKMDWRERRKLEKGVKTKEMKKLKSERRKPPKTQTIPRKDQMLY